MRRHLNMSMSVGGENTLKRAQLIKNIGNRKKTELTRKDTAKKNKILCIDHRKNMLIMMA